MVSGVCARRVQFAFLILCAFFALSFVSDLARASMAAARDRPLWLPLHLNRLPDGLLRLITFIRLRNSQAFVHSLVLFMLFPVINLKF